MRAQVVDLLELRRDGPLMAKMRGIKPETFTDDKMLRLSPLARWLFVGMWTLACDNGHLEDNAVQLKVRLLPMDTCDVGELVAELLATGQVTRHDGYLKVTKLSEHQRIDKRFLLLCEWCEHDVHTTFTPADKAPRTASAQRAHDVQPTSAQRAHVDEGEGEGEGERNLSLVELDMQADPDRFEEWWNAYDNKTGKKAARAKWDRALKKNGVTADLLIQATKSYITSQRAQNKHPEFTKNPATWLNGEHWTDERRAPAAPKVSGWWNQ